MRKFYVDIKLGRGWVFQPFLYHLISAEGVGLKLVKRADKEIQLDWRTYYWGKRIHIWRGETAYSIEAKLWRFATNAMLYHRGTTVRGFRIELSFYKSHWLWKGLSD